MLKELLMEENKNTYCFKPITPCDFDLKQILNKLSPDFRTSFFALILGFTPEIHLVEYNLEKIKEQWKSKFCYEAELFLDKMSSNMVINKGATLLYAYNVYEKRQIIANSGIEIPTIFLDYLLAKGLDVKVATTIIDILYSVINNNTQFILSDYNKSEYFNFQAAKLTESINAITNNFDNGFIANNLSTIISEVYNSFRIIYNILKVINCKQSLLNPELNLDYNLGKVLLIIFLKEIFSEQMFLKLSNLRLDTLLNHNELDIIYKLFRGYSWEC